ncbi:hypothetical protein AMTRI_Chr01g113400 [Amborella trichopoda]
MANFQVEIIEQDAVVPALPLQESRLPLSNLDLLLPPIDFVINNQFSSMVTLCCQVVNNGEKEPEILCGNKGVEFSEASADIELKDLDLHQPDESVKGNIIPTKKWGVLCVQLTKLKCGSIVVACTFDHRVADAYWANMFLISWAQTALSKPPSMLPSFQRSLLKPRRPGSYNVSHDRMFMETSLLPISTLSNDRLCSRIYYMKAQDIHLLQATASSNGQHRTKLESFAALLWQILASEPEFSRKPNKKCRLGIVVDGRSRLGPSMSVYFGNVLAMPFKEAEASELKAMPFNHVAGLVHECLIGITDHEFFRGLVDWVEMHRPKPVLATIYCQNEDEKPAVLVSSGLRFPVSDVDFGWGRPVFGSYHFPWGGTSRYVMPMPSALVDGDWAVYMHLPEVLIEVVDVELGHVFHPMNASCLNLYD